MVAGAGCVTGAAGLGAAVVVVVGIGWAVHASPAPIDTASPFQSESDTRTSPPVVRKAFLQRVTSTRLAV